MFCPKCGTFVPDGAAFCPNCGTQIAAETAPQTAEAQPQQTIQQPEVQPSVVQQPVMQQPEVQQPVMQPQFNAFNGAPGGMPPIYINPNEDKLHRMFSSSLFLVTCILLSCSVVLKFFSFSFDIIGILLTIAVWMVYANACSSSPASAAGHKLSHVALMIEKVLLWISFGLYGLFALIMIPIAVTASQWFPYMINTIDEFGSEYMSDAFNQYGINGILAELSGLTGTMICVAVIVLILVVCVICLLVNLLFVCPAVKYAKALSLAASGVAPMPDGKKISVRFLIFAILAVLFSAGGTGAAAVMLESTGFLFNLDLFPTLATLSGAASLITAFALVRKNY